MQVKIRTIEVSDKQGSDNRGSTIDKWKLRETHERLQNLPKSLVTAGLKTQLGYPILSLDKLNSKNSYALFNLDKHT